MTNSHVFRKHVVQVLNWIFTRETVWKFKYRCDQLFSNAKQCNIKLVNVAVHIIFYHLTNWKKKNHLYYCYCYLLHLHLPVILYLGLLSLVFNLHPHRIYIGFFPLPLSPFWLFHIIISQQTAYAYIHSAWSI